ncbi:hypothetical protein Pst134EA_032948 [Puccinia striiformis f. sp. tritici]|uniref:uncharacterized protein n=1 Tax=Puccinia striiformis f. sp. tritici TaxID=168172 RepID=UPI002007B601|nr:uncharacterized protein Pst134EA_032948 [Puccinia striiformis f. sp. tritici]KAH9441513.1 hypothetical protein Pst134EA_032948 [Puccinia striiformis f. sp. tritici]
MEQELSSPPEQTSREHRSQKQNYPISQMKPNQIMDSTEIVKRSLESEESGPTQRSKTVSASRKAETRLYRARKGKKDRANEFETVISNQSRLIWDLQFLARKFCSSTCFLKSQKRSLSNGKTNPKEAKHDHSDKDTQKTANLHPVPRAPTEEEQRSRRCKTSRIGSVPTIGVARGLPHNIVLKHCRQFMISPTASGALSCDDITSAIGWSKDITRLEILDRYRNEKQSKQIKTYTPTADKTRQHMKKLAESGLGSSLATSKVDNGEFVFPDIKQAIQFPSDNICVMIFRAQQHAHGTLPATEFEDSTKLMICIQPPNLQDNRTRKNNPMRLAMNKILH